MNDLQRGMVRYLQKNDSHVGFHLLHIIFAWKLPPPKPLIESIIHQSLPFGCYPVAFLRLLRLVQRKRPGPWKIHPFLMVCTRKDEDFHGRTVSFREGMPCMPILDLEQRWQWLEGHMWFFVQFTYKVAVLLEMMDLSACCSLSEGVVELLVYLVGRVFSIRPHVFIFFFPQQSKGKKWHRWTW